MIFLHPTSDTIERSSVMPIPVEQQVAELASVGLVLADGIGVENLFDEFTTREEVESEPYLRLVELMSGWTHDGSNRPMCPRVWGDDTECIYDEDAYAQIVQRLQVLSSGKPTLSNITGGMNVDAETAYVTFEIDGSNIVWDFSMDGDWLNTEVFAKYSDMLAEHTGERLYYVIPSEPSQEFILVCLSDAQAEKFTSLPNIKVAKIVGEPEGKFNEVV